MQARDDLIAAVEMVRQRDAHLLTDGEIQRLTTFLSLEAQAQQLVARLATRKTTIIRVETLDYPEITDLPTALAHLVQAGMAQTDIDWPGRVQAHPVEILRAACKSLGLSRTGRRHDLVSRLLEHPNEALLTAPLVQLQHRPLFQRVARLFMGDTTGDLSRLVLDRMGIFRFVDYPLTQGDPIFPNRATLLAYETALEQVEEEEPDLAKALEEVTSTPPPEPNRRRYRARRFYERLLMNGARNLEREGYPAEALDLYNQLIAAHTTHAPMAHWRASLCEEALGRPQDGAKRAAVAREQAPPALQRSLDRTGRRLARKARTGWIPLPPLQMPGVREVDLARTGSAGPRPTYEQDALPVEAAIIQQLNKLGREALHAETGPWSTLFSLLFREALFAPIPGMLPVPGLRAPLDLGTPLFMEYRREQIEIILEDLTWGEGPPRLEQAIAQYRGESIVGIRVDPLTHRETLMGLTTALDGAALAMVMRQFCVDYRQATRGFPDLLILPGPEVRLAGALPATVPGCLVLAEVKGPTDTLQDHQRVWLDRLLVGGVCTEVWNVRAI